MRVRPRLVISGGNGAGWLLDWPDPASRGFCSLSARLPARVVLKGQLETLKSLPEHLWARAQTYQLFQTHMHTDFL